MDNMLSKVQEGARRMLEFLGPLMSCLVVDVEVGRVLVSFFQKLTGDKAMVWWEEFKKFCRGETCWAISKNLYLRPIATVKLSETLGQRTLAKAKKLFTGFLDGDFANWGTDVPGEAKPKTPFEVFELVKDGTFAQVFGAFGVALDELCLSQDQIITFVEDHANLLHPKGWATFFLFKVDEEFFVVRVRRVGGGQLKADVRRLSYDGVWPAVDRQRFVVPQQTS